MGKQQAVWTTLLCVNHNQRMWTNLPYYIWWMCKSCIKMPNKGSMFSFQSQRKAMPKNTQTTAQLHSSHRLVKWCSKFSKPGFNSMWTVNFQMFKLDFERQRNQRSNCQHPLDHQKSKRVPEKHLLLLYWLYHSLWLCGPQQTGKFFKRWEYQSTRPSSWEICMQVRKQQLELDMEQQAGSK